MQESKEKIRSRMIRNASKMWGYQDTQSESSFDPFVGMILGALAGKLANISNDIHSTESRVLEKLVELLTPEPITGPFPAHSVIRAKPVEADFTINPFYQFYFNKRITSAEDHSVDEKPVFFTPAGKYKLFNGQVKYLANGNKIFEYHDELFKETLANSKPGKSLNQSEIWIALELDENIKNTGGLSFFFDLKNDAYNESFYETLGRSTWMLAGEKINCNQGFGNDNIISGHSINQLLQKELDITTKVCNHINNFYQNRFITLSDLTDLQEHNTISEKIPQKIQDIFPLAETEKLEKNLRWINIQLHQVIPHEVLDDLFCSINCFPAFNRHLNEFTQSSREFINIIPLITDEAYLDMKRVTSSDGKLYQASSFAGINEIGNGTFLVRHGGVGRFDSRNAAEILNYLLELLRDESAAFSIIGTDMISSDLKELNQVIARLEQRLKDSNLVKEDISYLLLKSHPKDEILFVEFWSTNGEFANKIKSGEKLFVYEGSDLWPDSVSIITPSVGGRESLNTESRVNAYRKSLLSHGRVVTKEDIKALCFEHFGSLLKNVEVKKGVKTGQSKNDGFIQTMDIFLTLEKTNNETSKEEIQFLKNDLLVKLEEQSANVLPFRCFINNS